MSTESCQVCGGTIERGDVRCTHCGARRGRSVSRVWVLTFFVMGVVMGLLLLVLQGGHPPAWFAVSWPDFSAEEVASQPPAPPQGESASASRASRPASRPARDSTNAAVASSPAVSDRVIVAPMQCNREAAQAVHDKASELATLSLQGGVLQLYLGRAWEFYSPGLRRSFVETFAEADRCLQGVWRPMHFSFRGAEVATVSAEGAIEIR